MKKLTKILPFCAVILAAIAIVMFFLPFVNFEVGSGANKGVAAFSGFQSAFGADNVKYAITVGGFKIEGQSSTKLVAVDLIAFILLCVGLLAGGINLGIKTNYAKFIALGVICSLAVAGILLFFTLGNFFGANEVAENAQKAFSIGAGPIIAGILAILGACTEAFILFRKK